MSSKIVTEILSFDDIEAPSNVPASAEYQNVDLSDASIENDLESEAEIAYN